MPIDPDAESLRLRTALRDLVALSTIPAAWVGRDPPTIAAGLADVLVGSLHLDFAFVRLCDPNGGAAVDVTRGNGWQAFPEWLQRHLAAVGKCSRKEIIPDVGGGMERCRGLLIPIGVNADGGLVAVACDRPDFPTETDQLLLSVAANHAATAFQSARLIHERRRAEEELRQSRDELEIKVAERTAELRRSEAYSAEAQRLSHSGSFGWKVSSGEIYWSEETFRIFQYDRTVKPTVELVLQRVHPEDAAFVKQTIERSSQDEKDFDVEYRLLMPDGFVKHVQVVGHALTDESGGIEFVGAVMDVTEQHQARAALERAYDEIKKSQHRLRLVIDTIPGMVWSGLPDGTFDFVNEPWLRYLGCSWEELTARGGLMSVVHPDQVEESLDRWKSTLATGKHTDHEVRMRGADGQYRWFLARVLPLRDDSGNIIRFYGTATDIEDRKRAEMLLGGEKRLLEMIARGDSRALILDDLCRHVEELASGSLSSILLLDPNGKQLRHGASPSLPPSYTEALDRSFIGPSVGSCGTAAYSKKAVIVSDIATDARCVDYRDLALAHGLRACWSTPILSSDRRVLGTFAIYFREPRSPTPQEHNLIEQVTHLASIAIERDQAEEALQEAQAELAHVTRVMTMGELVASIAHEVNQPLGAIVTNGHACVRLLSREVPDLERSLKVIERMIKDGMRASEVIKRIRDLLHKAPPEKALLNINETIQEVIALVGSDVLRSKVELKAGLEAGLPLVLADRIQLQQVILNLILNAKDAMSEVQSHPRELLITSRENQSGELVVAVRDSGRGLNPKDAERIFDPFFTTKPEGMGLGLSISRTIIEAHGGALWAVQNEDAGVTVQFTLPPPSRSES